MMKFSEQGMFALVRDFSSNIVRLNRLWRIPLTRGIQ
jgi:hypothetical protein